MALASTAGGSVDLAGLVGRTVVYCYPRTGRPDRPRFFAGWDRIPGARGCTPQSCAFRDHHGELAARGATVFGLSTQDTEYQREAVGRLHLPFALLSDVDLGFARALRLPTFTVAGTVLIKRLTLIDCRNNPDPALVSRAAAAITRRSILGDQPAAVG